MKAVTTRRVDLGRGQVDVTETGRGPTILLLHGVASSRQFLMEAFAVPLVRAGWRVAAADLIGHGQASPAQDPDDYRLERLVDDVRSLAAQVEPSVLAGVSLGAHMAVTAAVDGIAVDAVLACLPGWTGQATRGVGPHAVIADQVVTVGVPAMIERMAADTSMDNWLRSTLVRDWRSSDPASIGAALRSLDGGCAPSIEQLSSLAVPTGVIGWDDDPGHPIAVARAWAKAIPAGTFEEISISWAGRDRTAFGKGAVRVLERLGVAP